MRIHGDPSYSPATPTLPERRRVGARPIPSVLYWLLGLAIGSSFYVAVEPAPTDVLFLLLFATVIVVRGVRFPLDLNPIIGVCLLGFFCLSSLSLLASEDMGRGVFFFSVTVYLLIAWYVVVTMLANYGTPMWELVRRAFLVAATMAALIGVVSHFTTVLQDYLGLISPYGERARGSFKDPNVYAPFLCAALILVINHMITQRMLSLISICLAILFSIEILAAFSRGGYVNLLVSVMVLFSLHLFIIFRRDWLTRWFILALAAAVILLPVIIGFLQLTNLEDFFWQRLQLHEYDSQRFSTHSLALDSIETTILGIGPGQADLRLGYSTHQLFLRVAAENGILALVCFGGFVLAILWTCLRKMWRDGPYRDLYACCFAILAGIFANSLVIDSLHWRHMFLFLAVPVGLAYYERSRSRASATAIDPVATRP